MPRSPPTPTSISITLLGSGTAVPSIWYESQRRVAIPPTPLVLTAGSEYNPKAVMGSAGRSDPITPPSARVLPGTKVKESQALAVVVQLKTSFCPLLAKAAAFAMLLFWTSNWEEAYQLPSIWTAMRNPGIPFGNELLVFPL